MQYFHLLLQEVTTAEDWTRRFEVSRQMQLVLTNAFKKKKIGGITYWLSLVHLQSRNTWNMYNASATSVNLFLAASNTEGVQIDSILMNKLFTYNNVPLFLFFAIFINNKVVLWDRTFESPFMYILQVQRFNFFNNIVTINSSICYSVSLIYKVLDHEIQLP